MICLREKEKIVEIKQNDGNYILLGTCTEIMFFTPGQKHTINTCRNIALSYYLKFPTQLFR